MTGAKVVDNHLINTPVFSVIGYDGTSTLWLQEFEVFRVPHPNALTLDTSHGEPGQTAQRIVEHVQRTEHGNRLATYGTTRGHV